MDWRHTQALRHLGRLSRRKWIAGRSPETSVYAAGTTFLVASMRAYVKSKFGDEVDLT